MDKTKDDKTKTDNNSTHTAATNNKNIPDSNFLTRVEEWSDSEDGKLPERPFIIG